MDYTGNFITAIGGNIAVNIDGTALTSGVTTLGYSAEVFNGAIVQGNNIASLATNWTAGLSQAGNSITVNGIIFNG